MEDIHGTYGEEHSPAFDARMHEYQGNVREQSNSTSSPVNTNNSGNTTVPMTDVAAAAAAAAATAAEVEAEQRQQQQHQHQRQQQYIHEDEDEEDEMGAMPEEMHQDPQSSFNNVAQGLQGKHRDDMLRYWQETINSIEHDDHKFKIHQLPLARIKKVMKADEDVRMISAEAPILFAKGCDIFITELTMRAWIHAEENKRRTLQRSDIANALQKSDMFDFLIDIVPREEALNSARRQQQYPEDEEHQVDENHQDEEHREVEIPAQDQPMHNISDHTSQQDKNEPNRPAASHHQQGSEYVYQYGDLDSYNGY